RWPPVSSVRTSHVAPAATPSHLAGDVRADYGHEPFMGYPPRTVPHVGRRAIISSQDSEDGYDINHVDLDSLLSGLSTRPKPMHSESSFPVVLEELSLANSDVVLRAILVESIFDFSHLQKLAMDVSRTNLNAVWTVIHPARASLSELSFRQSYIRGWTLDAFSFDTCTLLYSRHFLHESAHLFEIFT
ncbi:hypothetical protein BDZ97DRAFT_1849197, partial [Flammula alnicola]